MYKLSVFAMTFIFWVFVWLSFSVSPENQIACAIIGLASAVLAGFWELCDTLWSIRDDDDQPCPASPSGIKPPEVQPAAVGVEGITQTWSVTGCDPIPKVPQPGEPHPTAKTEGERLVDEWEHTLGFYMTTAQLGSFAARINDAIAAEREACATLAERQMSDRTDEPRSYNWGCKAIAMLIRGRSTPSNNPPT